MMIWEIVGGVLMGALLGGMNIYMLRLSVRRALSFQHGGKAVAFIFGTYVLRYLIIALVVIALVKLQHVVMALTILGVLATLTIVLAIIQQQHKARNQGSRSERDKLARHSQPLRDEDGSE